jgi:hypothetical protein
MPRGQPFTERAFASARRSGNDMKLKSIAVFTDQTRLSFKHRLIQYPKVEIFA